MSEELYINRSDFKASPVLPMIIELHRGTILTEVKSFKNYIIESRNNISERQNSFNDMIKENLKSYPNNEQIIYAWFDDEHYQYNEFYPTIFNNSTLLSIYSFFEFNLKNLCISMSKCEKFAGELDDLNDRNLIKKSKKYLTLIANLDLKDIESIWVKITDFQKIRNCIVHNNSNIVQQKDIPIEMQKLYSIVNGNKHLKLDIRKGAFVIDNDQFLLDMLDLTENYLLTIIGKLETNK